MKIQQIHKDTDINTEKKLWLHKDFFYNQTLPREKEEASPMKREISSYTREKVSRKQAISSHNRATSFSHREVPFANKENSSTNRQSSSHNEESSSANREMTSKKQEVLVGRGVPFERTRRITGYLVGSLDRFNKAKTQEERDRVKHDLPSSCQRTKEE